MVVGLPLHLNFCLGPCYHVVNALSDALNFVFSVEIPSDLIICLNELLELFLEAVVLIIQVGHVLVKGIDLGLQLDLVFEHLVGVLLQTVNLVAG